MGHLKASSKKVKPHERNPCAPKFEERTSEETLQDKKSTCPQSSMGFGEKNVLAQGQGQSYVFILLWKIKASGASLRKNAEERMFVVESGASMHMLSKKDLNSDEMDTLRRSRNPNDGSDSETGEVQTNEEAPRSTSLMFTISICSSQCIYSMKRQQFSPLVSFAQNTDVHMSGKMGRQLFAIMDQLWEDNYLSYQD